MGIERYTVEGRETTLYITDSKGSPLVVLNDYFVDGGPVMKALKEMVCPDLNLLCVGNLKWNHDMTPWLCSPLSPKDTPCTGCTDDYMNGDTPIPDDRLYTPYFDKRCQHCGMRLTCNGCSRCGKCS